MKRILLSVVAILAILALVACGGGSSNTTRSSNPSSAAVSINVGDATADRLLSFEVTVSSVTLTGSSGPTANLLPAAAEVELTHLSGKFEPLRLMTVPAGSYTGATFTLGSAEAVIIPQAGGAPVKKSLAAPGSPITITFPAVTVGATASVLNFDFNLTSLVTVSGDTVAYANPIPAGAITVAAANQVGQVENEQENETGELEDIHGSVSAVNSTSFVLNLMGNSQQLTFNVDANTTFSDGLAAFSGLKVGMVVKVEGITKADGSLLAKEVEGVEIETGEEAEGIVTATNITAGAGTITMTVHEASASAAANAPQPNASITVNVAANTQYRVDLGSGKTKINNQNLAFDAAHLGKGQKLEADDDSTRTDNLVAKKIKLKKQAFAGTWTVTGSAVTLVLPTDSFFLQLNPTETSIKVLNASGAITKGTAPTNGATNVRVRGLLFFDPAAAAGSRFTLVAGRIDQRN
jgi:hypothetical protein